MTKIIPSLILVFCFQFLSAKINTEEVSVFFESGKSELSLKSLSTLDSLVAQIPKDADFELFLAGHTDRDGSKNFNDELSEKRALAVSEYLIQKGMNKESFTVRFFGELKPFEAENGADSKRLNRRVQIKITRFVLESLADLENALKSPSTLIKIDASKEQDVIALQGSKLCIPADAFTNTNGELVQQVELRITEALDFNDFIGNRLGTLSGDKLLITGGMLKIEAYDVNGEKLSLVSGKSLGLEVPNSNTENGMLLFTSEAGENWTSDGQEVLSPTKTTEDIYNKRPFKIYPKFRMPKFSRDLKTKPMKPVKPSLVREPKMPEDRLTNKSIKWYMLWNKRTIEKNREKIIDKKMAKYDEQMAKYRERKSIYDEQLSKFLVNKESYKSNFEIWESKQISDSANFENTELYLNANAEYARLCQMEDDRHAMVLARWQTKVDSILDSKEDLSTKDLNRYVARTSELSWINIDKYMDLKPWETRPITVKETDDDEKRVIVVFEDLKTVLPLSKAKDADYKISKIPKKNKGKILAYKVKDGRAYVYYESLNKNTTYKPVYKPLKIRELRNLLNSLNS